MEGRGAEKIGQQISAGDDQSLTRLLLSLSPILCATHAAASELLHIINHEWFNPCDPAIVQEKLGDESEMTVSTVKQLEDLMAREVRKANEILENAQLYSNRPEQFQVGGFHSDDYMSGV